MTDRFARFAAALFLIAPLATAPLAAQGIEYAPGTMKYRLTDVRDVLERPSARDPCWGRRPRRSASWVSVPS